MTATSPRVSGGGSVHRGRNRLRRWVLGAGILFSVLLAAGVWRVSHSPVVVPFLSTYLAAQLDHVDLPFEVHWEDAAVHWQFPTPWVHVRFSKFRASESLSAEGLGVRVSLEQLLRGQPMPEGLVLYEPTLSLVNGRDPFFLADSGPESPGTPLQLLAATSLATLEVVDGTITMGASDAAWRFAGIRAEITEADGWISAHGTGAALFDSHPAVPVDLVAHYAPEEEELVADIEFDALEPLVFASVVGDAEILRALRVPFGGTIKLAGPPDALIVTVTAAGGPGELRLQDSPAEESQIAFPVTEANLELQYSAASGTLELRELAVVSSVADWTVTGSLQDYPDGPVSVTGSMAGALPARVLAEWVESQVGGSTAAWVDDSVAKGNVTAGTFAVEFPEGLDGPGHLDASAVVRDAMVTWEEARPALEAPVMRIGLEGPRLTVTVPAGTAGTVQAEELQFRSDDVFANDGEGLLTGKLSGDAGDLLQLAGVEQGPGAVPRLGGPVHDIEFSVSIPLGATGEEAVAVRGQFKDLRVEPGSLPDAYAELDIRALTGSLEYGHDGLDAAFSGLLGSAIELEGAVLRVDNVKPDTAFLTGTLIGPIEELAVLGKTRPHAVSLPVMLEDRTGTARIQFRMHIPNTPGSDSELHILGGTFEVPSVTPDGFSPGWLGSEAFRDVSGRFTLDEGLLAVSGQARLADSSVSFAWRGSAGESGAPQTLDVRTLLGDEAQRALGLDFSGLTGPVDVVASLFRAGGEEAWALDLQANLSEADVAIEALDWTKPSRAPLHARVQGVLEAGAPLRLQVEGVGVDIRSRIRVRDGALEKAELERFHLGETRVAGTVDADPGGPLTIALDGEQVDLRPILGGAVASSAELGSVRLLVHARRARTMATTLQGPVALLLESGEQGVQDLLLKMHLGDGEAMELRGNSADGALRMELTGTNARSAGAVLGLRVAANNGTVRVEAVQEGGAVKGTVHVDAFQMVDAPVFLSLLQSVTILGLFEQIARGGGVAFSSFDAEFALADGILVVENGFANGVTLGIRVSGTIDINNDVLELHGHLLPANIVNEVLAGVPFLQNLITGADSTGVLSAPFAMSGPVDDPDIAVSPQEFLTPGILRDFWRVLKVPDASSPSTPQ